VCIYYKFSNSIKKILSWTLALIILGRIKEIIYANMFTNAMKCVQIILVVWLISSCQTPTAFHESDIRKEVTVKNGVVVSAHPLATEAGIDVLEKGGNAVDAAIATHFALSVVYPVAGNIGGGGFMLIRMANGEVAALDFREMAPLSAGQDMYLDESNNVVGDLSTYGVLASGVPGSVKGMEEAYLKYGKTEKWTSLVDPAVHLASKGFRITNGQARRLNYYKSSFKKYNTNKIAFVKMNKWKAGSILRQKELSETLKRISKVGSSGFYQGETAELIADHMEQTGGAITMQDLSNYTAVWREPIVSEYKDYTLFGFPPPSSGGIAVAQLMELIEDMPLSDWGFHSTKAIHAMAEVEKLVYADRAKHLGDPDFYQIPIEELLSAEYLNDRRKLVNMYSATPSSQIESGKFSVVPVSEETTHISVVDSYGNAVSLTTTLNLGYGSKVVVPGAGFLLNNEMDDFSIKPGFPNAFGLIGGEANSIEPGKRMLSSMTPTIVLKNDELYLVVGTPGGSTIITSVFQVLINLLEFNMSLYDAVQTGRFHHQWLPDMIFYEQGAIDEQTHRALETMGHELRQRSAIGRVEAILFKGDHLEGVADNRGDDHAGGY
jgi:gamma-glutamyltranspeptidase/glutathione hydrolase